MKRTRRLQKLGRKRKQESDPTKMSMSMIHRWNFLVSVAPDENPYARERERNGPIHAPMQHPPPLIPFLSIALPREEDQDFDEV